MDDCVHDYRIEMFYHDETFDFQARCKRCDRVDAPDVVNAQIEELWKLLDWNNNTCGKALLRVATVDEENVKLRAEIQQEQAMRWDVTSRMDARICDLVEQIAKLRAELAAREAKSCATCKHYHGQDWICYGLHGYTCKPDDYCSKWEPRP